MSFESTKSRIGLYLVITFALSSIFYALMIACGHVAGGFGLYVVGLMWCPAMGALLTCRIAKLEFSILGWSWGNSKWAWAGYLIPLGYATAGYLIIWNTGLGTFGNVDFEVHIAKGFAWAGAPRFALLIAYFILHATTGMVSSVSTALGEEIGWRGFLTPHMNSAYGFTKGALLTGVIWALWHSPILIFADYNLGTPWYFSFPCFAVMVLSVCIPMAWLRLRSNSLWPAAIFHASHNLFIQAIYTPLTSEHGKITPYAIDEFGFVLPLVTLAVAIWFWRKRKQVAVATT
jgi:membrane protease YdiL (CAAX protease family)